MERIEVRTGAVELRDRRYITVRHSETALARGLDPDERVVLQDSDGGYRSGTVEDVEFTLDDTEYLVRLGVVLPDDLAAERLSGVELSPEQQGIHDVVDLIGELRRLVVPV
jgi:hypothetical protein